MKKKTIITWLISQNACECGNGANERTVSRFYLHHTVLSISSRVHLQHTPTRPNSTRSHVFQDPDNIINFKSRLVVLIINFKSLTLSRDSFHFDLLSSVGRYSLTSRFQKWFIICCRFCLFFKLAGIWLSNFPGGRELNGRLIRKWLGVRGISLLGRSATFVRGLVFKMASHSTSINWNTSSGSRFEPRMISRVLFAVCIKRSQTPPKGGP